MVNTVHSKMIVSICSICKENLNFTQNKNLEREYIAQCPSLQACLTYPPVFQHQQQKIHRLYHAVFPQRMFYMICEIHKTQIVLVNTFFPWISDMCKVLIVHGQ